MPSDPRQKMGESDQPDGCHKPDGGDATEVAELRAECAALREALREISLKMAPRLARVMEGTARDGGHKWLAVNFDDSLDLMARVAKALREPVPTLSDLLAHTALAEKAMRDTVNDPLAQTVERPPFNRDDAGSIPAGVTEPGPSCVFNPPANVRVWPQDPHKELDAAYGIVRTAPEPSTPHSESTPPAVAPLSTNDSEGEVR